MYSSPMRLTGLFTGMDTDLMVKQLMRAETMKMNRLAQRRQLTEWRQMAYRDAANSLFKFQSDMLSLTGMNSIRMPSTFESLVASVSSDGQPTSAVKARIDGATATKNFEIKVDQAATNATVSGKNMTEITASKFLDGPYSMANLVDAEFNLTVDGITKTIKLNSADFALIDAEPVRSDRIEMLQERIQFRINEAFAPIPSPVSGDPHRPRVVVHLDQTGGNRSEILSFSAENGHTYTLGKSSGKDLLDFLGFTNQDISSTFKKVDQEFGRAGTMYVDGFKIEYKATDTYQDIVNKINNSGAKVTASYDSIRSEFKLESNVSGSAARISLTEDDPNGFLHATGLYGGTRENGVDAIIWYNGAWFTRSSNTFELNGVEITISGEAAGNVYKIDVTRDTAPMKAAILKFVEEYNKVVEMLGSHINTARPKSDSKTYYEPLTEEQRNAMSDKDIERWEEKAMTGLLYHDDVLTRIASQMRTMMYETVTRDDGSKIALYMIGITTTNNYKDGGKLEIEEAVLDKALATNPDAIKDLFTKVAKNADGSTRVASTVKDRTARMKDEGIGERLNDIIENAIRTGGSISSKAGTVYSPTSMNDNTLLKQLISYDRRMSEMLIQLHKRENHYYDMFAKMESAMMKASSQMDAMMSTLGGGA